MPLRLTHVVLAGLLLGRAACSSPPSSGADARSVVPDSTELAWSRSYGGAGTQSGLAIAMDESGDVVVAGYSFGSIDLGGGPLGPDDEHALGWFVARLDDRGQHLSSQRFECPAGEPHAVAIDARGDIYVAGVFRESLSLGDETLHSEADKDAVILKLDRNGEVLWTRQVGLTGIHRAEGIAASPTGGAYVVGHSSGTLDLGDGVVATAGWDVFLVELDADGEPRWGRLIGDDAEDLARDVVVSTTGGLYMTGSFGGTLELEGHTLSCAEATCLFLLALDAEGHPSWSRAFPHLYGCDAAAGPAGGVVLAGAMAWPTDFGGGELTPAGYSDAFVASFDAQGKHVWSRRFGNDWGWQGVADVASDADHDLWLTGSFTGEIDFGGGLLQSTGDLPYLDLSDVFVAKLDRQGLHRWSASFGDEDALPAEESGRAVAVNAAGRAAVTGGFTGRIDFGGDAHEGDIAEPDVFVAQWSSP